MSLARRWEYVTPSRRCVRSPVCCPPRLQRCTALDRASRVRCLGMHLSIVCIVLHCLLSNTRGGGGGLPLSRLLCSNGFFAFHVNGPTAVTYHPIPQPAQARGRVLPKHNLGKTGTRVSVSMCRHLSRFLFFTFVPRCAAAAAERRGHSPRRRQVQVDRQSRFYH